MKTESQKADVRSCGVLVFRDHGDLEFLLMKHTNRWDLPKGHMDDGETELQTALRELEEETGIESEQIKLDSNFRYSQIYTVQKPGKKSKRKELVIFLATWLDDDGPEIQLTEHPGYAWVLWDPPHEIQEKTIDTLLLEVSEYWSDMK